MDNWPATDGRKPGRSRGRWPLSSAGWLTRPAQFHSIGIGAALVNAGAELIEYPADGRTLFLPIETVIAAFG